MKGSKIVETPWKVSKIIPGLKKEKKKKLDTYYLGKNEKIIVTFDLRLGQGPRVLSKPTSTAGEDRGPTESFRDDFPRVVRVHLT